MVLCVITKFKILFVQVMYFVSKFYFKPLLHFEIFSFLNISLLFQDPNDPVIKEILSEGPSSQLVLFFLYCINAPLLEETVYRGFLLTSLATKSKPWLAIIVSSCVFSLAHFSFENSFELFIVGCALGYMYCWTGSLVSPIIVHSVYNAVILLISMV